MADTTTLTSPPSEDTFSAIKETEVSVTATSTSTTSTEGTSSSSVLTTTPFVTTGTTVLADEGGDKALAIGLGAGIGGTLLLILVIIIVYCCCCRRRDDHVRMQRWSKMKTRIRKTLHLPVPEQDEMANIDGELGDTGLGHTNSGLNIEPEKQSPATINHDRFINVSQKSQAVPNKYEQTDPAKPVGATGGGDPVYQNLGQVNTMQQNRTLEVPEQQQIYENYDRNSAQPSTRSSAAGEEEQAVYGNADVVEQHNRDSDYRKPALQVPSRMESVPDDMPDEPAPPPPTQPTVRPKTSVIGHPKPPADTSAIVNMQDLQSAVPPPPSGHGHSKGGPGYYNIVGQTQDPNKKPAYVNSGGEQMPETGEDEPEDYVYVDKPLNDEVAVLPDDETYADMQGTNKATKDPVYINLNKNKKR